MVKNIILCSDGTGNRGGKGHGTNVWRLFRALDRTPASKQVAFYDDGVGTEDFKLARALGGALGCGLSRNIRELYTGAGLVCRGPLQRRRGLPQGRTRLDFARLDDEEAGDPAVYQRQIGVSEGAS